MRFWGGDLIIREHVKSLVQSFIYAVVVFILLYIFLWPVRIVGVSMEPTLNDGDRVFVSRAAGFVSGYNHGDLVMIRVHDDVGRRYIIKRVIATSGDILVIKNGQVIVNNEVVVFSYNTNIDNHIAESVELMLPLGYYFLVGDNHTFSTDSRDFGPLYKSQLRGLVLFRFMGGSFNIGDGA